MASSRLPACTGAMAKARQAHSGNACAPCKRPRAAPRAVCDPSHTPSGPLGPPRFEGRDCPHKFLRKTVNCESLNRVRSDARIPCAHTSRDTCTQSWQISCSASGRSCSPYWRPRRVCGRPQPRPAGTQSSLYARMGGSETVTAVVAELIDHSVADPKLKRSFEGVDVARVKRLLVEQICSLAGGGCTYSGDSMRDVHAGLKIEQSEFYGLVEVLREALRSHGVGLRERNELLADTGSHEARRRRAVMRIRPIQFRDRRLCASSATLARAGEIGVEVRDLQGNPLSDAVVFAQPVAGPQAASRAGAARHDRPGEQAVRAARDRAARRNRSHLSQQRQHPPLGLFVLARESVHDQALCGPAGGADHIRQVRRRRARLQHSRPDAGVGGDRRHAVLRQERRPTAWRLSRNCRRASIA